MFIITQNQDIMMTRGDTVSFDVRVMDGGREYTLMEGDMVDFRARSHADGPVLIHKTGQSVTLLPEDTADLPNGRYIYDVTVTQADGTVSTIIPERLLVLSAEV